MFEPDPDLRLLLVTGGVAAGKTRLAQRLFGELPRDWRIVPLDNFARRALALAGAADWPRVVVALGGECLGYWKDERTCKVLVEGLIQDEEQVAHLAKSFGEAWPSKRVRVLFLTRSFESHKKRRADPAVWNPAAGISRDDAMKNLETRTPKAIKGATVIHTDSLDEDAVLAEAIRLLRKPAPQN